MASHPVHTFEMLSKLAGKPLTYYLIFAASGFAGLVYESIWARYLKLMLGHAAYAQALVLAIFLLGLAAGSAICARLSSRIRRPLLCYALIEAAVAVAALLFHDIFVAARTWLSASILPALESDAAAETAKWTLAALLILPQSVLLGATFPLMSAGLARRWPESTGMVVSMLYFTNSLGAAFGVLASGLLLVPAVGLPGTSIAAGGINMAVAAAVWLLVRDHDGRPQPLAERKDAAGVSVRLRTLVLSISLATGLASFVYELVWIRMLSLLLGSSSHSFEVMLAAFILGLALGGYAVRRAADRIGDTMRLLAWVQLVMGACALLSLFMFPLIHEMLRAILSAIERDAAGYRVYIGLSMALAMLMMLPATFCAGMTLPLLTKRLMQQGGEAAIGSVYAANTLGAIGGVFLTLHILLPQLGIQGAMLTGGFIDLAAGVAILLFLRQMPAAAAGAGLAAAALLLAFSFGGIDPRIAAAGVFRNQGELPQEVTFYREGKTASISVTSHNRGTDGEIRSIRTNGKTDAGIYYHDFPTDNRTTVDETTMVSSGLYPLLFNPDARLALNIGFGSGFTSRTLLLSDTLVRLDNVEIEPVMVAGARTLGERVAPVFSDERNRFIFDDAKAVLSRAAGRYDIIVSEPSNPWVSGTAGLFTREFYADVANALSDDGILIQWYHTYESGPHLLASTLNALATSFPHFRAFAANSVDIIIVASKEAPLPEMQDAIFRNRTAREFLGHYGYRSPDDARISEIGDEKLLLPYLELFGAPANSDYFPYLESNAPLAFFMRTTYVLSRVPMLEVPAIEIISGKPAGRVDNLAPNPHLQIKQNAIESGNLYRNRLLPDSELQRNLARLDDPECREDAGHEQAATAIMDMFKTLMPFASAGQMEDVWKLIEQRDCGRMLLAAGNQSESSLLGRLLRGISQRQPRQMIEYGERLLDLAETAGLSQQRYRHIAFLAALAGHYAAGDYETVIGYRRLDGLPVVAGHAERMLRAAAGVRQKEG